MSGSLLQLEDLNIVIFVITSVPEQEVGLCLDLLISEKEMFVRPLGAPDRHEVLSEADE